ncbi:MAG: hypothetical protein AAGI23_22575 [Bacteroidota bacterium]
MRRRSSNNWEKQFKQKLDHHDPQWDTEEMWGAIEVQLPEKKKRRLLLLLLFLFGFILAAGVVYQWQTSDDEDTKKEAVAYVQEESVNRDLSNEDFTLQEMKENTEIQNTHSVENNQKNEANVVTTASIEAPSSAIKSISNTSLSKLPKLALQAVEQPIKLTPNNISLSVSALTPLSTQKIDLLDNATPEITLTTSVIDMGSAKISIQPYIGVSLPNRQLVQKSGGSEERLLNRQQYERPLESIEAGVLLNLALNEHFAFQFGIERQQLTERLIWEDATQRSFTIQSDSAYFYFDDQNQKQFVSGEFEAVETTTRLVRNYNRYTLYNLPMMLSYRNTAGKWGYSLHLGGTFNFHHAFEGRILENENVLTAQEVADLNLYRSNLGWASQFGLGIDYLISSNSQLSLQLSHRYFLNSFTRDDVAYDQRYQLLGLQLGWRINLD